MERYITDKQGERKAVILDIENFKALVSAADDARNADEVRCQLATGEDKMIDLSARPRGKIDRLESLAADPVSAIGE